MQPRVSSNVTTAAYGTLMSVDHAIKRRLPGVSKSSLIFPEDFSEWTSIVICNGILVLTRGSFESTTEDIDHVFRQVAKAVDVYIDVTRSPSTTDVNGFTISVLGDWRRYEDTLAEIETESELIQL